MSLETIVRKAAFVIVDLQNDFCPGGSLAVKGGDEIVGPVNRLSPLFPCVVATKDWHPAGHVSFASGHPGKKPFETVKAGGIEQILWPDHCVRGTPGAELHPGLDVEPLSLVLHKGRNRDLDSYSAFFENDRKTPTGLEAFLKGLGFKDVFLCGLATDVCVFYSARDALGLGFGTYVVEDASRGVDLPEGSAKKALTDLEALGAKIVTTGEIVS